MNHDATWMKRAIRLARKGTGHVSPNPRVGAVVVKGGQLVAEGYHAFFGGPHAERVALSGLSVQQTRGADLYVTLEPCDHHGKTPPCTEIIIQSGIARVFIGIQDPNPLVSGRGIQKLRKAGIEVIAGIEKADCRDLNPGFISCMEKGRPFVTLKTAQTLDGFIATENGLSKWITGEKARKAVHRLRSEHDAVLVGIGTVLKDDPELTVRHVRGVNPKRIVLDARCRIPESGKLFNQPDLEKTILVVSDKADASCIDRIRSKGCQIWRLPDHEQGVDLHALLARAKEEGICSILVEGGRQVFSSFIKEKIADRLITFVAPKLFGIGLPIFESFNVGDPDEAIRFTQTKWKRIGQDFYFEGNF